MAVAPPISGRVPRPEGVEEGVQDEEVAHVERVGGGVEPRVHRPALRAEVRGEVVGGLVREQVEQEAALVESRQEVSAEVKVSLANPPQMKRTSP